MSKEQIYRKPNEIFMVFFKDVVGIKNAGDIAGIIVDRLS